MKIKDLKLILFGRQIHHSVLGLVLFLAGFFIGNNIVLFLGLLIYFIHVLEEMIINKENLLKALSVFITKQK